MTLFAVATAVVEAASVNIAHGTGLNSDVCVISKVRIAFTVQPQVASAAFVKASRLGASFASVMSAFTEYCIV